MIKLLTILCIVNSIALAYLLGYSRERVVNETNVRIDNVHDFHNYDKDLLDIEIKPESGVSDEP